MRPQRQPEAPMRVAVPKSHSLARGTSRGEGCGHVTSSHLEANETVEKHGGKTCKN